MDCNERSRREGIAVAGLACLALAHAGCTVPPTIDGANGVGGAAVAGQGGGGRNTGGVTGNNNDAAAIVVNLDVAPPVSSPEAPLAAPTIDSNCGALISQTTRQPADVLLVLDRSASMQWSIAEDCDCSGGGAGFGGTTPCTSTAACTSRWDAVKPAVTATVTSSKYVNWGLKMFPSPGAAGNCNENTTMEVSVSATSASAITAQLDSATFSLSTPTAAAINAATGYLRNLNDGNKKFILVATDGEPNCGGTRPNINTDDVKGASDAAAAAAAAGIPVYVVGIGPNLGNLTQLAQAGGTKDFYAVSSPDDLVTALSSISKLVGSCTFESAKAPPDDNNIAVYVNGEKVPRDSNDGWTFGASSQEIVLTGDYCAKMSSGTEVDVQILFGCPGQPDFPPNLY